MYVSLDLLLDCPNGAFYFTHMHIMQPEADSGGEEIVLHALKSHVTVYVNDIQASCLIQF